MSRNIFSTGPNTAAGWRASSTIRSPAARRLRRDGSHGNGIRKCAPGSRPCSRRIAGLVLAETAATVDRDAPPEGWDCDAYFAAEAENALFARRAFGRSHVVQYVNFWPCGWANARPYMSRFFELAAANGIGVGGPDIVPDRPGQMANSYPFIRAYRDRVPLVAMAVQEPTLEYVNPATGRPFTRREFESFAIDYLGVDAIFWSKDSPWLRP